MNLKTQPNEARCLLTTETHILEIPECCPMTKNPRPGSTLKITYQPADLILEVQSLFDYVKSFVGGRGNVRSMEGMIQEITKDCALALSVEVTVEADLILTPCQKMFLICKHQ